MSERVLFVDDEQQVLDGIQRSLRKHLDVHIALGGERGLAILEEQAPFAVVISDMRMPGMNGAEFLAKVRSIQPDAVRMVLSGQSDLQAAISAVNESHIYRFLSKPCPQEQILAAVNEGLQQYRLLNAEKVLLQQTLSGAVKMLIEILDMVSPSASGRAARVQRYVTEIAKALSLELHWTWGLAAYVSQIGCVALPRELMSKIESSQPLDDEERRLYEAHPHVAGRLLAAIPRLEEVAEIAASQFDSSSFAGCPEDVRAWDAKSTGKLLLRVALALDRWLIGGVKCAAAAEKIRTQMAPPRAVIAAVASLNVGTAPPAVREIRVRDLACGMILEESLMSPKGIRLVPAGQVVTRSLIVRLNSIAEGVGIVEPFRVRVPG